MIPLGSIQTLSSVFVLHCERENVPGSLISLERSLIYHQNFFVSNDLGGVIHQYHCGESLFVAFKHIYLISFLSGANPNVTDIVYWSFLNSISVPCFIFLMIALSCFVVSKL